MPMNHEQSLNILCLETPIDLLLPYPSKRLLNYLRVPRRNLIYIPHSKLQQYINYLRAEETLGIVLRNVLLYLF